MKEQLIDKLIELRQRIGQFEELEAERKRAQEGLRESEELLRSIVNGAPIVLWTLDPEGVFTLSEGRGLSALGLKPGEVVGRSVFEVYRDLPQILEHNRRALAGEEFTSIVEVARLWFDCRYSPLRDQKGEVIGIIGVATDITERKRAEEEVQRHLDRLAALREIDRAISFTLDLSEVLDIILEQLDRIIPYHSSAIFLLTDDTAKVTATRGFPDLEKARQVSFPVKDDALAQQLLEEKRPLVLADAQANERFHARGGTEYVRSWIGVPLIVKGKAIGFLTIDHKEPGVYDEESAETAQAFASQAAVVIENARLFEEERRRATQLATIGEVSQQIALILDLDELLCRGVDLIRRTFGYYYVYILLVDPDSDEIVVKAAASKTGKILEDWRLKISGESINSRVARSGQPLLVNDVSQEPRYYFVEELQATRAELAVPIKVKDRVIGTLDVQSTELNAFDDSDLFTLQTLAEQFAIAIENAHAYQTLEDQNLQIITALATAIEARDPYTSGHSQKVTEYATATGEKMGLSEEEVETLRLVGLLHDIGKMGIPDSVLNKPSQLTAAEYAMVNTHPVISAEIVGKIEAMAHLVPLIKHHHERHDGRGYPDGLKGEDIPLQARILAVADGFEAMTSERPYRSRKSREEAVEELKGGAGTQWDPEVVKAFLEVLKEEKSTVNKEPSL